MRLGVPKVVSGWRVGRVVSASTVCKSVDGWRTRREKSCRWVESCVGIGDGRYRAMRRLSIGSSVMESWDVRRGMGEVGGAEYWGETMGRDWKKPDVKEDG